MIHLKDGVSILPAYRNLKYCANEYGNLKVNLVFRNGAAVIHVAGTDQEFYEVERARVYVSRVLQSVMPSPEEVAEQAAMLLEEAVAA